MTPNDLILVLLGYVAIGALISIFVAKFVDYIETRDDADDFLDQKFRTEWEMNKNKILIMLAVMWLPLIFEAIIGSKNET